MTEFWIERREYLTERLKALGINPFYDDVIGRLNVLKDQSPKAALLLDSLPGSDDLKARHIKDVFGMKSDFVSAKESGGADLWELRLNNILDTLSDLKISYFADDVFGQLKELKSLNYLAEQLYDHLPGGDDQKCQSLNQAIQQLRHKSLFGGDTSFAEMVTEGRVTVFCGQTGSGKSEAIRIVTEAAQREGRQVHRIVGNASSVFEIRSLVGQFELSEGGVLVLEGFAAYEAFNDLITATLGAGISVLVEQSGLPSEKARFDWRFIDAFVFQLSGTAESETLKFGLERVGVHDTSLLLHEVLKLKCGEAFKVSNRKHIKRVSFWPDRPADKTGSISH